MSDQAAVPQLDSAPALNQWERVANTFIAPSKTFADIRRNTSWWLPWLIASVLIIVLAFTVQQKVGWHQAAMNVMNQNPNTVQRMQKIPASRRAEVEAIGAKTTEIITYADPVLLLLLGLIVSAILWGTINFVFGGRAKFGQVYAVWFYSMLPMVLISLLAIISLYAGLDPSGFNMKNPVGTNIGYYMPGGTSTWLVKLLTSVDVLKIWTAVLLTIGCASVAQIKKSRAAIAVFGWWIIFILLSVAGTVFAK